MKEENIPSGANKGKKRLGRGEGNGHGKTCCRGHKGAGARLVILLGLVSRGKCHFFVNCLSEGLIRKVSDSPLCRQLIGPLKINGEKVDMESLKQAGLIRPNSKDQLLGTGEVDKAYQVQVTFYSRSAKEKIEAAGGSFIEE